MAAPAWTKKSSFRKILTLVFVTNTPAISSPRIDEMKLAVEKIPKRNLEGKFLKILMIFFYLFTQNWIPDVSDIDSIVVGGEGNDVNSGKHVDKSDSEATAGYASIQEYLSIEGVNQYSGSWVAFLT